MPKTPRPRKPSAQKSQSRPENQAVLDALRAVREEADLLQSELAARLGRSQSYVSSAERGVIRLDAVQLADWAKACGSTLTKLAQVIELRWR
ncbi:helix-turn-helix domain-containing protein [Luteibacter sp. UNCMF366Tsu5.1]|uniref:helix-turn-helix domain-containing protein n=1 Tax=Luteibacter sp. UNCMF366Tsu5.1 TaxID=1502758 RepID=UPI0009089248|nr:helix-turn-helix transcriptional regulator [Luteibacter sp. UNCMF366Tsu5.1]SFW27885.1 Helix-turn-helix [Luteibacter sp. UNCMF366Tsu5.1]